MVRIITKFSSNLDNAILRYKNVSFVKKCQYWKRPHLLTKSTSLSTDRKKWTFTLTTTAKKIALILVNYSNPTQAFQF